ncbi:MAG: indolepyruvate ferredoxin oxidoreductase subunit alpha [Firmicutes bacterium]|nr:indolepyruvate ferredoxin oxidoreductase subunit alpha [Bacillota bacterium]
MIKKILTGNQAIGIAAIECGLNLATGYPGTPSTEILETVFENSADDTYVEWSVNEKVALEVGGGAAIAGARVLTTMKQVGLNVAADPFMGLTYLGVQGALVIAIADDPGPHASQTEQDTRMFAKYSNVPIFDPSSPQEAYSMTKAAFLLSETTKLPVIIRPTTRVCHGSGIVEITNEITPYKPKGFYKSSKWVIFPKLSYQNHIKLEEQQKEISKIHSDNEFNYIKGNGKLGIATGGITATYVDELTKDYLDDICILKVGNPYPFPDELGQKFLEQVDRVLVLEELDPVIEEALIELSFKNKKVDILGKKSNHIHYAGELKINYVKSVLEDYFCNLNDISLKEVSATSENSMKYRDSDINEIDTIDLPHRQPTLCAGCPHRASFYAVKEATKKLDVVYSGDIGCYTLGNAKPLEVIDTCLCMGAGITMAQGLHHINPDTKNISFIGDSTYFHTGIPGIINATYNDVDMTIIVLDNKTTAMTGNQYHPGIEATIKGQKKKMLDIGKIASACGVEHISYGNPYDIEDSIKKVQEAVNYKGTSLVIFRSPCVSKLNTKSYYTIDNELCKNCNKCIDDLGCPALYNDGLPHIDKTMCTGCGICKFTCKFGAIREGEY